MFKYLLFCFVFIVSIAQAQKTSTPAKKTIKPNTAKTVVKAPVAAGYNITITIKPLKNEPINLYSYYGTGYKLADSGILNSKSTVTFKGNKKLPGGIYTLIIPNKRLLFDLLMDETQHFTAVADTANINKVAYTGSPENVLNQEYTDKLIVLSPPITLAERNLKAATTAADSALYKQQVNDGLKAINIYREQLAAKHPDALLTTILNAMKRPEMPAAPVLANGTVDSLYPFYYVKDHFWDDADFSDDRLLNTPFFEQKIDDFYRNWVGPVPDSIIKEVKTMLLSARGGEAMYNFLLRKFTAKYMKPEIMGQDKVFVYLFENHYLRGDTSLLSEKDKKIVIERGYYLMSNQIGLYAPQLILNDSLNAEKSLYDVQSKYTLVIFWDPNCGHCKEMIPKFDSAYNASWKSVGVKVFAVNIERHAVAEWKKYITENKLSDWIHVYQTQQNYDAEMASQRPGIRQLYDVVTTPTIFLLDNEKHIIAKNLDINGFNEIIKYREKNKLP